MSDAVFDELIHAPLRLQICAMLLPIQLLGFSEIRDSLGVSDSVLSKHLSTLAGAGYVEVSRVRTDARSRRRVSLTDVGRTAVRGHLAALQTIAALAAPAVVEDHARAAPGSGHRARRTAATQPRIA